MTGFLTGLVARARDGAPELARRRPSPFERPTQAAPPAGLDGLARPGISGPESTDEDWEGGLEDTATAEAPDRTGLTSAAPRPARGRTGSRATPRSGESEPPPGFGGDERTTEVELAGASGTPEARSRRTTRTPPVRTPEAPVPAPLVTSRPMPGAQGVRFRSIETIVEVPAPARPAAPLLPQPSSATAREPALERPHATSPHVSHVQDSGSIPPRAEPVRLRSGHLGHELREASGELGEPAPVRPLRRRGPGAAGPQDGVLAGRNLPGTTPTPAPPAIHVTIGRIEIRATPGRTPAPVQAPRPSGPKLGLDEYLRSRSGRGR